MKNNLKVIIGYVLAIVVIVGVIAMIYRSTSSKTEVITYDKVVAYFQKEEVREFEIDNKNNLTMLLYQYELDENGQPVTDENGNRVFKKRADGSPDTIRKTYKLARVDYFHEDLGELIKEQIASGVLVGAEYEPAESIPFWLSYLPGILLVVVLIFLYWRAMKTMMSGAGPAGKMNSFGKARVKTSADTNEKDRVTFKDVAGADEEKEELQEIVEFLKDPKKFARLGAKIPHGVLLMGPPGTGKTLLAKAVAGEADVPFFSISGSDFVEMYVGVGASRVRDLFETARKAPASIVFIDEIDAVGRHRGAGLGGGHDEREQTLNQLLVEMDGFGSHEGIIVMAATNRPDILDPALLRPGRFDRQITVNYPDINGREEILKVHARNKKFESDVDFSVIAKTTAGFTGADLANLLNEAALLAVRRGKSLIGMDDIEDAFMKVLTGPQKKSRKMLESERRNTAYHEAGHAIVGYYMPTQDPVHMISIIPAGQTLGVTVSIPTTDKFSVYRSELNERIAMILGGRVAEMLTFGDFSGGASNDIQRATSIAHSMVTQLGMSDVLGPIRYGSSHGDDIFLGRDFATQPDYSEETAAKIDAEVHRIVNEAFAAAKKILTEHADKLKFVAEYLLEHETMDGDQFNAVMDHDATAEELEKIAEDKKRRSSEANKAQAEADEKEKAEAEKKENAPEEAESGETAQSPEDGEDTDDNGGSSD